MNNEKKVDRRIAKTRKAIQNAYITLLKTKPANDISIKELADVADISRKTFYNYYDGIWEIEEDIENTLVNEFHEEISSNFKAIIGNPSVFFERFIGFLNSEPEFYGTVLSMDSNSHLLKKVSMILFDDVKAILQNALRLDEAKVTFIAQYIITGGLLSFQIWYNQYRNFSVDEFSKLLTKVIVGGISQFTSQNKE